MCGVTDGGDVIVPGVCEHIKTYFESYDATCTESGYVREICAECNIIISEEYTEAFGHSYNENGVCANCGKEEVTIPDISESEIRYIFDMEIDGMKLHYDFYTNGVVYAQAFDSESGKTMTVEALWQFNEMGFVEIVSEGEVAEQFTVNEDDYTLTPVDNSSDPEEPDYPVEDVCKHENVVEEFIQEPTCVDDGVVVFRCDVCGITFENKIVAFGHDLGELEITIPPESPDQLGEGTMFCYRCSEVIIVTVIYDPNGEHYPCTHSETEVKPAVESTCNATGWGEEYCILCGIIVNPYYILPLAEHSWDYKVISEPTLETSGTIELSCQNCGYSMTQPISYDQWKEITEGYVPEESVPEVELPKEEVIEDVTCAY